MTDEQAIANLISRLALFRDRGEWEEAAALLAGATFETHYPAGYDPGIGIDPDAAATRPAGTHGRQRGAREIADLFRATARLYEDGLPHTQYVTTNLIIDVDEGGDSATARAYYTILQSRPDFPLQPIAAGRYLDRLAKVGGEWRFTSRDIYADHTGDLSHHLAMDPIAYGERYAAGNGAAPTN